MVTFVIVQSQHYSALVCFDFQIVSLTCHGWQQSSYQDNSRAQLSNSGVVSLEPTVQWGPGEEQVCLGQILFLPTSSTEML